LTKVKLGFATLTWRQARLKTLYHGGTELHGNYKTNLFIRVIRG